MTTMMTAPQHQQQQQQKHKKYNATTQHDWNKKGRMAARTMNTKTMTAWHSQQQEQQQHIDISFGPMKRLVVPDTTARSTAQPNERVS